MHGRGNPQEGVYILENQERDPRPYELMTVFVPELSEEDNQAQIERTEGYITAAGGTITETLVTSPWGRRRLAYTIRYNGVDYRDGFYTVFHFDARPTQLTELEREMKLDTNVMRYLLVHDDPKAGEKFSAEEGDEAEAAEGEAGPAQDTPAEASGEPQATTAEAPAEAAVTADTEPATTEDAPAQDAEAAAEVASTSDETPAAEAEETAPAAEETAPVAEETDEAPAEAASSDDTTTKE